MILFVLLLFAFIPSFIDIAFFVHWIITINNRK